MKRLLLVDYMGSVYYHFHAKEKHVEYNFLKNLQEIVKTYKPDKVLILCEGGGSTFRTKLHPGYKASRKARKEKQTPEEKKEFMKFLDATNRLKEMLKLLGVAVIESWGVEADDIAAYLCHHLSEEEYQLLLCTEDSDWAQLIHRRNTVIGSYKAMLKEPLTKERWRNYARLTSDEGLNPEQMFVKKMLIGDTADDIPGLDGVGKGFAQQIVEMHPTLEQIEANKDQIKLPRMTQKAYASLANCEETFKLGYQLMNLRWPEEKWVEIFTAEKLDYLQERVNNYLSVDNSIDKAGFLDVCYQHGWLIFAEEIDEFLRPFQSK